jgi:tRNA A37 threonylcarbamoyladenosine modification protein TsaB
VYQLLAITISTPLLLGVYKDDLLIETITLDGKTSDLLPISVQNLLSKYDIREIYYVNGPGSYMAIKVSYIFFKTLEVLKGIKLYACDGFEFNNNSPIKAIGKKYFIKDSGEVRLDSLGEHKLSQFELPNKLENIDILDSSLPNYNLPAV